MSSQAANVEESYTQQLKQQRLQWELNEKQKREKWITEKTKLIKDQTVRSLEPEIQRMLAVTSFFNLDSFSLKETVKRLTTSTMLRNTNRMSNGLKQIFKMKF